VTKRQQGEASYLVGMSLLAAALEVSSQSSSRTDQPERLAQGRLLADLAIDQFGQALRRNPELKLRARLRRAQVHLVKGSPAGSEEVARDLRALEDRSSGVLSDAEKSDARALIQDAAVTRSGPPTLRALRDELQAGTPFSLVLIGDSPRLAGSPSDAAISSWAKLFSGYSGQRASPLRFFLDMDLDRFRSDKAGISPDLLDKIRGFGSDADPKTRLIVVYSGRSTTSKMLKPSQPAARQSALEDAGSGAITSDRLFPFGRAEIEQIAQVWSGPVTVVVDTPFGGTLLQDKPVEAADISLFLAAREPNGMTFGGGARTTQEGPRSTTDVLTAAFEQGADDPAESPVVVAERIRWQRLLGANEEKWVVGTPAWLPRWSKGPARSTVLEQLEPLDRWGHLVAQGCGHDALKDCERDVRNRVENSDPMRLLKAVASADLSGNAAEVLQLYRNVDESLMRLAGAPASSSFGAGEASAALSRAADIVRARAQGAASKDGRRVHIISFGVEDYRSPLIADLPGTLGDLRAYEEALVNALAPMATQVVRNPNKVAESAKVVLDALASVRREIEERPQDLVILIFSGRGIELNGRRYLATAAADTDLSARAGPAKQTGIVWSTTELIDLWQIADIMRGRWFIGLYDTQFTQPVQQGRHDQLLDKHLDSVRPRDQSEVGGGQRRKPDSNSLIGTVRRGAIPTRQVHIWVDGQLTPSVAVPHPCLTGGEPPKTVSPLASAIVSSIRAGHPGTYRNWMNTLGQHDCVRPDRSGFVLSVQGDLDIPGFASGEGAEFVEYFRGGDARRDVNLRAAVGVAGAADGRFPSLRHKLSRGALLVSLIQLFKSNEEILGLTDQLQHWFDEARTLLDEMELQALAAEDAEGLWPMRMELLVRLHRLAGDSVEAVRVLHQPDAVSVLGKRELDRRLVEVTREAIDQQSTIVLKKTEDTLSSLRKKDPALASGLDQKLDLLRQAERERRADAFALAPPRGEGSPKKSPDQQ
jgi:hypothetical protein